MFPALVEVPPEGDDWIDEIKYVGYRTQLVIDGGGIRARDAASTGQTSITGSSKRLKATVRHLKGEEMLRHASLKTIRD
jgi:ATP-dependent DNA ligase